MNGLFYKFFQSIGRIFSGKNLLWQLLAVILTWIILQSGFDWFYFTETRRIPFYSLFFPAAIVGALLPIILPVCILAIGFMRREVKLRLIGWALGQAAFLGSLISSVYKFFTGRVQPTMLTTAHTFHFGLGVNGIFWGWPSSHAMIAFAMAVCYIKLFPKNAKSKIAALVYAFYVGLGMATLGLHWFSDFAAGAIIGSVIGAVVGKAFRVP